MLIQQEENKTNGAFFIEEDGKRLAEMTYSLPGENTMVIDHTAVEEVLRGKKIGNQLLDRAVAFARTNNFKIIPVCSFARSVFKRKPEEFRDVLKG